MKKKNPIIDADGNKRWYLKGKLHREDGPAIEYINGDKVWHLNGKLHREDGPALEYTNGDKMWYLNGKYHRKDGPAIEWANGDKYWYLNGELHREDGPAVEYANGYKAWYLKEKIIARQNLAEIFNQKLWDRHFNKRRNKIIMKKKNPIIDADGNKHWYLNRKYHREDGPAIEWADGNREWYLDGKRHRKDGPAYEGANGYKAWYINGEIIARQKVGEGDSTIYNQEIWDKMKPFNEKKRSKKGDIKKLITKIDFSEVKELFDDLVNKQREREIYVKNIHTLKPKNLAEKYCLIFDAFYWSVITHSNQPVPKGVIKKDIDDVWEIICFLRNNYRLSWIKSHAIYRIIYRKGNKYIDEVDVSQ